MCHQLTESLTISLADVMCERSPKENKRKQQNYFYFSMPNASNFVHYFQNIGKLDWTFCENT